MKIQSFSEHNILEIYYYVLFTMSIFQPKITVHVKKQKGGIDTQGKKSGNRKWHWMGKNVIIIRQKFQNKVLMKV